MKTATSEQHNRLMEALKKQAQLVTPEQAQKQFQTSVEHAHWGYIKERKRHNVKPIR